MELMTLNSDQQPDKMVENWDSLIWTERYNTVGDFQLTTGEFGGGSAKDPLILLPEGKMITLRESNVPMIVETHQIERKKNTPEKLTITGRAMESVLDRRAALQAVSALVNSNSWKVDVKTPSDAAYYAINQICVAGLVSLLDKFPAAQFQFPTPTDYLTSTGPTKSFEIPRGSLLATVLGLLQTEAPFDISTTPDTPAVVPHGIRAVRPNAAGTAIAIEIYVGVDRSTTVYFDATRDLLDDGTYLFSKVGSANVGYGVGAGMSATMFEGVSEPTGLDRRVVLVDASQSGITTQEALQNQMSQALSEAHETAMFDGSVNQDLSPYTFGVHYGLGDIVKVVGDYNLSASARVTEYIRSQDNTGFKAYPTLSTIVT